MKKLETFKISKEEIINTLGELHAVIEINSNFDITLKYFGCDSYWLYYDLYNVLKMTEKQINETMYLRIVGSSKVSFHLSKNYVNEIFKTHFDIDLADPNLYSIIYDNKAEELTIMRES